MTTKKHLHLISFICILHVCTAANFNPFLLIFNIKENKHDLLTLKCFEMKCQNVISIFPGEVNSFRVVGRRCNDPPQVTG